MIALSLLQVEPTTRCNLNCTYCTKKEPIRDLSVDTLTTILDRHPKIKLLKLQGLGEPFLAPNIVELCKTAKESGMYVMTITNGTCINYAAVEYIDRVMFSIDFLDPDKYNAMRPDANWHFVMGELHNVGDITGVGVNQVITHLTTKDDIEDMRSFTMQFGYALSQPRIENWGMDADDIVTHERTMHGKVERREPTCAWGHTMFYYDALGRPHPCCIRMNDCFVIEDIDFFVKNRSNSKICMRCPD